MKEKFDKFEAVVARIQSVFFCVVLAFMAVTMFVAVVRRYVFNNPLQWCEELTTVMQGALAFAGIGYCWHYKAHTRVMIVHDKLPKRGQQLCDLASCGIIIYCLYRFILVMPRYIKSKAGYLTSLRWLNYSVFNYVIYAGFVIAIVYILVDAARIVLQMLGKLDDED